MRTMMRCGVGVFCVASVCGCSTPKTSSAIDASMMGVVISLQSPSDPSVFMEVTRRFPTNRAEVVALFGAPASAKHEAGKEILTCTGKESGIAVVTFTFNDKGILDGVSAPESHTKKTVKPNHAPEDTPRKLADPHR